jgi:uncharacterized membrane protein YkvA (DUF1232 family)
MSFLCLAKNDLRSMLDQFKARAKSLKREVIAVYLAARDPRTPWYARGVIFLTVAYMFSPIDLIPDFVPVLGYLDDLLIVPGGIWLAIRLIPAEVMEEARAMAATDSVDRSIGRIGAIIIIFLWIAVLAGVVYLFLRFTKRI